MDKLTLSMDTINKIVGALMVDPKVAAFDAINREFMQAQETEAKEEAAKAKTKAAETGKNKK